MPAGLLTKDTAPHRARNFDVMIRHQLKVSMIAKGKSEDDAAVFALEHGETAIAFATARFDYYRSVDVSAEEAYDLAASDLAVWINALPA